METYIYFNKKLINKRKKLRLTISDAAKTLTLSTTQIKSLENNLDIGFASPKYKLILLKRYAKLLDIELEDLIENEDRSNLEKENKPPAQKTQSALHNKVNYSVLAIILFGFIIYFFNTDTSGEKTYEEFFTEEEDYEINKYDSLGFINTPDIKISFEDVEADFESVFNLSLIHI